jgi:Right handed beta helix region
MTRFAIAAALALAVTLPAVSAQAQSPRTFVSAAGSDSNPCSFAAPCRHFQAAVNATSPGGEVDALDPAGYGPITISQAITIEGQGWSYIAPPTGGNGITINAVSGNVAIHGVSLNGVGITGMTFGIAFNSGSSLTVRDSVIQNFTKDGIHFQPAASSQLSVLNTLVSNNGSNGISIPPTGSGTTTGVLNHVDIENNGVNGLFVDSVGLQSINVTFSDSVSANNGANGVLTQHPLAWVTIRRCTISNNVTGLAAAGSGAIVIAQSIITGNGNAWDNGSGGIGSAGDNFIINNSSNNNSPTITAYK